MKRLFFFILLATVLLNACAPSGISYRQQPLSKLPNDISVGNIEGPGSQFLIEALGGKNKHGNIILNGRLSINKKMRKGNETVPVITETGPSYKAYLADPFTGKIWKTKTRNKTTSYENYSYELIQGEMIFDWHLSKTDGQEIKRGRSSLQIGRSCGGFLAARHIAPSLGNNSHIESSLEKELGKSMAHIIGLELGRDLKASDLESAPDKQSRQAKKLAQSGDWESAKMIWHDLLKQNPRYSSAHYNLGVYWEKQGETQKAWEAYREAFLSQGSAKHRAALTRLSELMELSGMNRRRDSSELGF